MDRKLICWGAALFLTVRLAAVEPELVSVQQSTNVFIGDSQRPSLSEDGCFIAFESVARLTVDDGDKNSDIYVMDRANGLLERWPLPISPRSNRGPSVSGNGRFVAFHSYGLRPKNVEIPLSTVIGFVDRKTGAVTMPVSEKIEKLDGESLFPIMDFEGRSLFFVSNSTQIVAEVKDPITQAYVFDRDSEVVKLLSRRASDGIPSNRLCGHLKVSSDGWIVAYLSAATNFTPDLPPDSLAFHLYLQDRKTGTMDRIDVFEKGFDDKSWIAGAFDMDASGHVLIFEARPRDVENPGQGLRSTDLFLYDRVTDQVRLLTTGLFSKKARNPSMSGDGNFVAFVLHGEGIVVYDRRTDRWLKAVDGDCDNPALSKNGTTLAFERLDKVKNKKVKNVYVVPNPFMEKQ